MKESSREQSAERVQLCTTINGVEVACEVDAAESLMDLVRGRGLTGTHSGCEHGVCGACTVLVDDRPVRACIVLAAQVQGRTVETIESVGGPDDPSRLQRAFSACSGLQCGFCTPGFIMLATGLLRENPCPSEHEIVEAVSSNLCRCTGYASIVQSIASVVEADPDAGAPARPPSRERTHEA
ncbi:(2Fe-2S)-binding protein [Aeromicrobium phragmitis]|uniref:(2Fe-2S)-binding protein n=1 Tax=Aeromicrobium phragmitis TaxID=2478914 RepID=A0A3L8PPN5_9ACTN|nr:(2Fe-2S)-binding protein [Aeromicrobium phragmitis]RLV57365.1 (2Fe-2S)-binding protein [Aeromicrobium phragmitis]